MINAIAVQKLRAFRENPDKNAEKSPWIHADRPDESPQEFSQNLTRIFLECFRPPYTLLA
jgi:hypothetical protein